jgi:hypothetical protein
MSPMVCCSLMWSRCNSSIMILHCQNVSVRRGNISCKQFHLILLHVLQQSPLAPNHRDEIIHHHNKSSSGGFEGRDTLQCLGGSCFVGPCQHHHLCHVILEVLGVLLADWRWLRDKRQWHNKRQRGRQERGSTRKLE